MRRLHTAHIGERHGLMGQDLAANTEFVEQKLLPVKRQLPWHVHQLIIEPQKEIGWGRVEQPLSGQLRKQVKKDDLSQAF
jgi:hypothetical protein